jgi:hypothetical protein
VLPKSANRKRFLVRKPRGKPFEKGDDSRRAPGRTPAQRNLFTREVKDALVEAGENFGNRLVALHNAKLPKKPNSNFIKELIELSKLDPKGIVSYFEWLAEKYPSLYVALLGRALPHIMRHEGGDGAIEVVCRSAEDIEKALRERGLPPLQKTFQLPKRIDLDDDSQTIDVTP